MDKNLITQNGYDSLLLTEQKLLEERKEAVKELTRAREMGDLKENGFYRGAKAKLSQIDRQLRFISRTIRSAKIINNNFSGVIDIGCKAVVRTKDEIREFILVGIHEVNPAEGKISYNSPVGKELMGKKKGDKIIVKIPFGEVSYYIDNVYKV